ncbi:hypothetical protein DLAC_05582 [Tieghemostelium lacteum]|uniref:Uncharacterized protein n=1 Tax=Tieghemostelium lacteum TaxID=361077 RepID=A0A151ZGD9_TIELA|nr:hypothetical protein DLAC_05582 [Tieghemostelium lacteum]|eukprot:KYQ92979.1 hypothetical protein DLAC_05582 [Tieghemostelium lacteum]
MNQIINDIVDKIEPNQDLLFFFSGRGYYNKQEFFIECQDGHFISISSIFSRITDKQIKLSEEDPNYQFKNICILDCFQDQFKLKKPVSEEYNKILAHLLDRYRDTQFLVGLPIGVNYDDEKPIGFLTKQILDRIRDSDYTPGKNITTLNQEIRRACLITYQRLIDSKQLSDKLTSDLQSIIDLNLEMSFGSSFNFIYVKGKPKKDHVRITKNILIFGVGALVASLLKLPIIPMLFLIAIIHYLLLRVLPNRYKRYI